VLDQREDAAGHEPSRANRRPAPRDLSYLDDASTRVDLDPTAVTRGDDLVRADLSARIDDDLHPVTPHVITVFPESRNADGRLYERAGAR
jgi:hypothetical protein